MSDTEIRAMRYTIEQLSEKLHATEQYLRDVKKALDVAVDALKLFDSGQYTPEADAYGLKTDASRVARKALEQIEFITKGGKDER